MNFNYYYDRGRDLFAVRTGTTDFPSTVGTQATPENYGRVDSWGWELSLGWRDKIGKDWQYWVKLNTGYNDNKLLEDNFPAISELDSKVQVSVPTVAYGAISVSESSAVSRRLTNTLPSIILPNTLEIESVMLYILVC